MKSGSILVESLAILTVAFGLGTAVHKLRPAGPLRIAFVDQVRYPNALKIPSRPVEGTRKPVDPDVPVIKAPSPDPTITASAKGEPVVTSGRGGPPQTPQPGEPGPKPEGAPRPEGAAPKAGAPPPRPEVPGVREIAADEVLSLHKEGMPFVDARRTRFYTQGHIPGARSLPVWEADLDQKISAFIAEVPVEMAVVVYCSSGDCEDSHMLAGKLKLAGYQDLRVFKGGFPEWQKRNLPVEGAPGGGASGQQSEEER